MISTPFLRLRQPQVYRLSSAESYWCCCRNSCAACALLVPLHPTHSKTSPEPSHKLYPFFINSCNHDLIIIASLASPFCSLTLACAQVLLLSCSCAPTSSAMLAQLQPGVLSALASFLSHSSMSISALSAATCYLIVQRCQGEGAQLLHHGGIPGELEDVVEVWSGRRRDGSHGATTSICDQLIAILSSAQRSISSLIDSSISSPKDAAAVVQQLRQSGRNVDASRLRSLFIGPHALSALQLLKSGLPLALSQFLCAENDYPRPSAQYQLDRRFWFFQQLSCCADASDGMQEASEKGLAISDTICREFLSAVIAVLIDGISSKEQVHSSLRKPRTHCMPHHKRALSHCPHSHATCSFPLSTSTTTAISRPPSASSHSQ